MHGHICEGCFPGYFEARGLAVPLMRESPNSSEDDGPTDEEVGGDAEEEAVDEDEPEGENFTRDPLWKGDVGLWRAP